MLKEILKLVGAGVPYDVALNWTPARRLAALVAVGELAGGVFDWNRLAWNDPT